MGCVCSSCSLHSQWWKTAGSQSLRLTIACNTTMNCAVRFIKQTYPFPSLFIPFYISTSKSSTWLSLECSKSTTSFTMYQSKINLSLLRSFAIPLPPVEGPKSVSESSLGLSISLSACLFNQSWNLAELYSLLHLPCSAWNDLVQNRNSVLVLGDLGHLNVKLYLMKLHSSPTLIGLRG